MLFRRVLTHVRKQEWTAIGLDFLIVVIGVFVGLQANNWNAARAERQEEGRLLERLEADFRDVVGAIDDTARENNQLARDTGTLVELLRREETEPDLPEISRYVTATSLLAPMPIESATYLEMISTGSLSRIRDVRLRQALTTYGQNVRDFERNYQSLLRIQSSVTGAVEIADAIRINTRITEDGEALVVGYDWAMLRAAEPQIQAIQIFQNNIANAAEEQAAEVREILTLIEKSME
ncbi:MAG: hypothetical protein RIB03_02690 [Henriciella sp.]|uniref:hypothetical protein n=1 Tax=Henriciella sp. TaxID=1968823 RepID=UPI0032F03B5B